MVPQCTWQKALPMARAEFRGHTMLPCVRTRINCLLRSTILIYLKNGKLRRRNLLFEIYEHLDLPSAKIRRLKGGTCSSCATRRRPQTIPPRHDSEVPLSLSPFVMERSGSSSDYSNCGSMNPADFAAGDSVLASSNQVASFFHFIGLDTHESQR